MRDADKGTQVTVKSFGIEGASLIPVTDLTALLDDLLGRALTLRELEGAAQRITEHYRNRGWFVRVYLPAQDVTEGQVRIRVIEGRLGGMKLEVPAAPRVNPDFALGVVGNRLRIGEPLAAAELERGLLLVNDLPGIRVTGILEAGDVAGETRLRVKVEDTPLVTGDLGLNNQGLKTTGIGQATGGFALNDLDGRGDRLELRGLASEGLASGLLRYGHPLGNDGARVELRASHLRYRLGDSFAALDARGQATTWGGDLHYPIRRSQNDNLNLTSSLERRESADDNLGIATRRHEIDSLRLGLTSDHIDAAWGGGYSQYSLMLTGGDLDLSGVAADLASDQAGPRTQGRYNKLTVQFARLQRLFADLNLYAGLNAQWADGNLDSSEKHSLGGPHALRAYPVNEAAGDEGWLLKLELRKEIQPGWQAIAFVEGGGVRLHKAPWVAFTGRNRYTLTGAGAGLVWNRAGWDARLSVAVPLDDNPGRDANGDNSDGSGQHSARAWAQLSKRF
ncbi:MAG: ShlB/FhaC/HecB family hemolysin secretion/activation protein [Pseudomonadota bacterium]|nr:ShlB/FhaC/HecB family hemolysin secretion/activation protein [Pseudomonadota bacterium]MDP1572657.1 ShlB/FhaC/HecB family hemolysin secretion/activation protein [Pseudomonadota bacterium]MDP1906530.1 ShlB/FhaC/HecB family hemolysin secretion/activation protein [Pseudomonadota bacterium]